MKEPSIIRKLIEQRPVVIIKRNKFDRLEHLETGFVFTMGNANDKVQRVYGKQNSDGSVSDLTPEDICLCNKYKFEICIPNNLDKKVKDNNDDQDNDTEDLEVDEQDVEAEEDVELDCEDELELEEELEDDGGDDVEYYEDE